MNRQTLTNTENIPVRHTVANSEDDTTVRRTIANNEDSTYARHTVANEAENMQRHTMTNSEVSGDGLQIGEHVYNGAYEIIEKLDTDSGEADLYLAKDLNGRRYAVKHYRRPDAVDFRISNALMDMHHSNIASIHGYGELNGRQYEVMEFYSRGSLEGRRLDAEEIRKKLVPEMNEAIEACRKAGIVHKDIKPANIMLNEIGEYVLADFGVSELLSDGKTHTPSDKGTTYEYLAPEVIVSKNYSSRSDYFALGKTIYELITGVLPGDGMTPAERAEYTSYNGIPFPSDFPEDIKTLILGLTNIDYLIRDEKPSPNKRWNYEAVKNWCEGKGFPAPGTNAVSQPAAAQVTGNLRLEFNNEVYYSVDDLLVAMAHNWDAAIKFIGRSSAEKQFEQHQMFNLAEGCRDVRESSDMNVAFASFIYSHTHELDEICYKNISMSPEELGSHILGILWGLRNGYEDGSADMSVLDDICEMIFSHNSVISSFYQSRSKREDRTDIPSSEEDQNLYEATRRYWGRRNSDSKALAYDLYRVAYLLTGQPVLRTKYDVMFGAMETQDYYKSKEELIKDLSAHLQSDDAMYLEGFLERFMTDPTKENAQLLTQTRAFIDACN